MIKFTVANVTAACLLIIAAIAHLFDAPFRGPATIGCSIIALMLLIAIWSIYTDNLSLAGWLKQKLTTFGLIGTTVGIIIGLGGIDASADPTSTLNTLISNLGLSLYSTLFGLVAFVWVSFGMYLTSTVPWNSRVMTKED